MGYIRHHAIVVTSFDLAHATKARDKAIELGMQVTEVVTTRTNAYCAFMVAPDGSKEGWEESEAGDTRRAALIDWIRSEPACYCDFVEVELDVDGDRAQLGRHSWDGYGDGN